MAWDVGIFVGLALCQGATGYWAFHMSTSHGYSRWGFAVVTVVGIALLVWSGIRANDSSNQLVSGVAHIEQIGVSNTDMLQMLSNIEASQSQILDVYKQQMASQSEQMTRLANQMPAVRALAAPTPEPMPPLPPAPTRPPSPLPVGPSLSYTAMQAQIEKSAAERKESSARLSAQMKCLTDKNAIRRGLGELLNAVVEYGNKWAYSRNSEVLERDYDSWVGAVRQYLSEHKDVLPDVGRFEEVKELDMGKTLLVIPSMGNNARTNFNARWKPLKAIYDDFEEAACKAEQAATSTKSATPSP